MAHQGRYTWTAFERQVIDVTVHFLLFAWSGSSRPETRTEASNMCTSFMGHEAMTGSALICALATKDEKKREDRTETEAATKQKRNDEPHDEEDKGEHNQHRLVAILTREPSASDVPQCFQCLCFWQLFQAQFFKITCLQVLKVLEKSARKHSN